MHDFCFTIPYGLLLVCGGVIGYAKKGSTASLAGGTGAGLLLVLAGYLSLQAFHKRKNSYFAWILETVIAAILAFIMGQRYMQTGKIMPAGIVAAISALMAGFYLYKIATGGNRIPPKTE
ncbi:UNVERIFIED_CONTAM: protein FATTY ACID EXPORT 5 [Sesamum radiatum]|uniref:Protein FATTY ACID EXPORT 5 n=1 Tax=Sesamum radiatum TaxID=300843 RepID=A0AAW2LP10_SESRA